MARGRLSHLEISSGQLVLAVALTTGLLAGCANKGSGPYAKPLPSGQSCRSIHQELRRMDSRGVPSKVEAVSAGRKVSAKGREQAARYNQLLNDYLAARCHTGNG